MKRKFHRGQAWLAPCRGVVRSVREWRGEELHPWRSRVYSDHLVLSIRIFAILHHDCSSATAPKGSGRPSDPGARSWDGRRALCQIFALRSDAWNSIIIRTRRPTLHASVKVSSFDA